MGSRLAITQLGSAEDDRCAELKSSLLKEWVGTILWIWEEGSFHCQKTLDFSQMVV